MNNPPIYRRKLDNIILDSLTDMISSYIGSLGIENADLILKKIGDKKYILKNEQKFVSITLLETANIFNQNET